RHPPARDRDPGAARRPARRGARRRDPDGGGGDRRPGAGRRALPGQPPLLGRAVPQLTGPVLVLGGTAEARALARALVDAGVRVVSSLAGRVRDPALPVGEVRVGGFGGAAGLAAWVRDHDVAAVVDATHPFASTMTAHAVDACAATGVELVVLRRPSWSPEPGWVWADSVPDAAALLPSLGER